MSTTCQNCGKEFEPRNKYAPNKTCSKECRYAMSAASNRAVQNKAERITATCANPDCGREIIFTASKPKRYCSRECYNAMIAASYAIEKTCPECGKTTTNYTRQDQIFCSVTCRNRATAKSRTKNYPKCRVCGASTGSYGRAYCVEHRPKSGPKPMPRKVAVCLGCGEEFSRPGTWPGKMNYCSNACSHKQVKKVRDKYVANLSDGAVVFHSGWEIRFWAACLRFNVPVRSYDGPDIETSVGTYRPDFIVGNDDLVVDVKGWLRPESEVKCRESGVLVVDRGMLESFEQDGGLAAVGCLTRPTYK